MSKLIRVSDKNHKDLSSMSKSLGFTGIDNLMTDMISIYRQNIKRMNQDGQ